MMEPHPNSLSQQLAESLETKPANQTSKTLPGAVQEGNSPSHTDRSASEDDRIVGPLSQWPSERVCLLQWSRAVA